MALPDRLNIWRAAVYTDANLSPAQTDTGLTYKAGNVVRVGTGANTRYFMCTVADTSDDNAGAGATEAPTTANTTQWIEIDTNFRTGAADVDNDNSAGALEQGANGEWAVNTNALPIDALANVAGVWNRVTVDQRAAGSVLAWRNQLDIPAGVTQDALDRFGGAWVIGAAGGGGGNPPIAGEVINVAANPATITTGTGTMDVTLTFTINTPYIITGISGLTANNAAVTFATPVDVDDQTFTVVATVPIDANASIAIAGNVEATLNGVPQGPEPAHVTVTVRPEPAVWYTGAATTVPTAVGDLTNNGVYSSGVTATIPQVVGGTAYILLPTVANRDYNFLYQGGSARIETLPNPTTIGDHTLYVVSDNDYNGSGTLLLEITHG